MLVGPARDAGAASRLPLGPLPGELVGKISSDPTAVRPDYSIFALDGETNASVLRFCVAGETACLPIRGASRWAREDLDSRKLGSGAVGACW